MTSHTAPGHPGKATMEKEYLDSLSDEGITALHQVLTNVGDVRSGSGSDSLKVATKTVDRILKDAPGLPAAVIIYQVYNGISGPLRDGEEITEKAFLTGTGIRPDGSGPDPVTVAIKLPAGTRTLCLPDGAYVLARNQTLILKPTDEGDIPAIIEGWRSLTASAAPVAPARRNPVPRSPTMRLYPQRPPTTEEFFNKSHGKDGRFSSGKGGGGGPLAAKAPGGGSDGFGGGALAAKTPAQKKARNATLKRIGLHLTYSIAVAGLVVGAVMLDEHRRDPLPRNPRHSPRKPRSESPSDWYDRMLREKPVIR